MGEWPDLFNYPAKYLDHLFFVIGNGVEKDKETSSFFVEKHLIHKFPVFDRDKMTKERMPYWIENANYYVNLSRNTYERLEGDAKNQPDYDSEFNEIISKHVFPDILPHDLSVEALYLQLKNDEQDPWRLRVVENDMWLSEREDSEYRYVRPYPLSKDHSRIFHLDENSPDSLLTVAYNFCMAWDKYLTEELDKGNYYKGTDNYIGCSSKERTEALRSAVREALAHVAGATTRKESEAP